MKIKPDTALEQARLHLRRAKDRLSRGVMGARDEIDAALSMLQLVEGWSASRGTLAEIELAMSLNIPVFNPGEEQRCIDWARMP